MIYITHHSQKKKVQKLSLGLYLFKKVHLSILCANMYISDAKIDILCANMYILGVNMYTLGANMYI